MTLAHFRVSKCTEFDSTLALGCSTPAPKKDSNKNNKETCTTYSMYTVSSSLSIFGKTLDTTRCIFSVVDNELHTSRGALFSTKLLSVAHGVEFSALSKSVPCRVKSRME